MDFTGILEEGRFSVCALPAGQAAWMQTKESRFSDSQAENLSWVNDPVQLGRASGIQTENGANGIKDMKLAAKTVDLASCHCRWLCHAS